MVLNPLQQRCKRQKALGELDKLSCTKTSTVAPILTAEKHAQKPPSDNVDRSPPLEDSPDQDERHSKNFEAVWNIEVFIFFHLITMP